MSDTTLSVEMRGYESWTYQIRNGLSQGSPLRVTLFQVFTADIPVTETDTLLMDDCALFGEEKGSEQIQSALQTLK
jgi:hypothetical protein